MSATSESDDLETASKLERILSGRRIFFRLLKGVAIGIPVVLVLSVIAFYAYENHIGEKAWLETKAKYEQQGLSFDLADFAPEMPLEEENFARCKVIRSLTDFTKSSGDHVLYDDPATRDSFLKMKAPKLCGKRPGGNFEYGQPIDLNVWSVAFRESENWNSNDPFQTWNFEKIRKVTSAYDSQILALASESKDRSFNQLRVEFGDTYFTHKGSTIPDIGDLRDFCYFLKIRANIANRGGDSELALKCVQLMLKIADTVDSSPYLIHNLVAVTVR